MQIACCDFISGTIRSSAVQDRSISSEGYRHPLKAIGAPRGVVSDPEARYFGGRVEEHSFAPLGEARLARIGFDDWLRRSEAVA
jgi:hypothetical protein